MHIFGVLFFFSCNNFKGVSELSCELPALALHGRQHLIIDNSVFFIVY